MPKPDLGEKRVCGECSAKFYDLNKDPIICPKCGTEYDPVSSVIKAKSSRPAPEDAEDEEDKGVDPKERDSDDEDDTFLEQDEDGNDDVSDIVGNGPKEES